MYVRSGEGVNGDRSLTSFIDIRMGEEFNEKERKIARESSSIEDFDWEERNM